MVAVLAAGGQGPGGTMLATSEIYDPATGTFSLTGSLATARQTSIVTLQDGRVLVAGGWSGSASLASAETYDPATVRSRRWDRWPLPDPGSGSPCSRMGAVLVIGGSNNGQPLARPEIFDPATNQFTPGPSLAQPRRSTNAVGLADGRVLTIGGSTVNGTRLATVEVFDPRIFAGGGLPDSIYGTPLDVAAAGARGSVAGVLSYDPATGAVLPVGEHTLNISFAPADASNYSSATASVPFRVLKATPAITWSTPASVIDGTVLGAAQLNATASVPGTFVYSPAAGTVLETGPRTLTVAFTPTDTSSYTDATASVTLDVAPPQSIAVIAPNGGDQIFGGSPYVITWTAVGGVGGPAGFDLLYSTNSGASFAPIPECSGLAGAVRQCSWNVPAAATSRRASKSSFATRLRINRRIRPTRTSRSTHWCRRSPWWRLPAQRGPRGRRS